MHSSRCVHIATEMRVVLCTAQSRLPQTSSGAATFTWFPVSGPPEERSVQLSAVPKRDSVSILPMPRDSEGPSNCFYVHYIQFIEGIISFLFCFFVLIKCCHILTFFCCQFHIFYFSFYLLYKLVALCK